MSVDAIGCGAAGGALVAGAAGCAAGACAGVVAAGAACCGGADGSPRHAAREMTKMMATGFQRIDRRVGMRGT